MILIADGGSTKVDWVAINSQKEELFRIKTSGLNPAVVNEGDLYNRIQNEFKLVEIKSEVKQIYFYGAGCGTLKATELLHSALKKFFTNAKIIINEDMLAAVYASAGTKPAIVCILGTGSNSCYFNGNKIETKTVSLGYTIMDEASGNYFGKKLLRDYFYNKMPKKIAKEFENEFNLDPDFIKQNLYRETNPNMYLATFAKFMFNFKDRDYIINTIKKGFEEFFYYRVLSFNEPKETPIYFIGSIAFYFQDILEIVARKHDLEIAGVIQRPIDNLLTYHKEKIN